MNAPPFPLNPNVGDWWQNWVFNGARWVASPTTGLRLVRQVFTASGPYMPSPGLVSCDIECIGGGGGGGSAGPIPGGDYILGGGGGGSGGYSKKTLPAALVRGGVLVTVGDGGSNGGAGAADGALIDGTGGTGGTTSFGAFCVANGGAGGAGNNANQVGGQNGTGGGGGAPGIGDVAWPGAPGFDGVFQYIDPNASNGTAVGGRGGWLMAGGPRTAPVWTGQAAQGPSAADNTGAGGAGSIISEVGGGPLAAGIGGSGMCIVTETCWGDRDQPDIGWRPPLDVNVSVQPPRPPWPGGQPGPVPPWPPGSPWWPWWPWPPGHPSGPPLGPQPREAAEFEAEQQSFQPWDDPNASDS